MNNTIIVRQKRRISCNELHKLANTVDNEQKEKLPITYLIAYNFAQASVQLEFGLRWKRLGFYLYLNDKGQKVELVSNTYELRGLSRGTVIYLGYRWYDRSDADLIIAVTNSGKYKTIDIS